MMGVLFIVRKVQPDILENMTFQKIKYWYNWHKLHDKTEEDYIERKRAERAAGY